MWEPQIVFSKLHADCLLIRCMVLLGYWREGKRTPDWQVRNPPIGQASFQASPCHGSTELAAPPSLLCSQPELSISCYRQLRYDYERASSEALQQPVRQDDCFLSLISVLGNWTCRQIAGLPFCSCFEPLLEGYVPKCLNGIGTTWNAQHSFCFSRMLTVLHNYKQNLQISI